MAEVFLKFAWHHGTLDVDEYDTLKSVLSSAKHASDYGNESLERIEQIRDGVVVGIYLMEDVGRLLPDEPYQPQKPRPYRLEISTTDRDGKKVWAEYDRYVEELNALKSWGEIANRVGQARVRVMHHSKSYKPAEALIGGP